MGTKKDNEEITRETYKKLSTERLRNMLNEPSGSYEPWAIDLIKDELNQRKDVDLTLQQDKEKPENEEDLGGAWDFKYQVKKTQNLFYVITAIIQTLFMTLSYIMRNDKVFMEIFESLRWLGAIILIAIIFNPTLKRSMKRFATWLVCILISVVIFLVGNFIIAYI